MSGKILGPDFFRRPATEVARDLLGRWLVHHEPQGDTGGIIVETEAYLGPHDPASHSARGKTRANAVMFGPAGRIYVYRIYGIHVCLNLTTDQEDVAAAVLIRALEPKVGIKIMEERRGGKNLTNGPARLTSALGIGMELNGQPISTCSLSCYTGDESKLEIAEAGRIGVSKAADWPLRFYVKGSPWVSRR